MGKLKVGYWAGQEQYDPNTLINYSKLAEVVGFDIVITSDHFHPWRDSNSFNFSPHSGFPWIWFAAAASKTNVKNDTSTSDSEKLSNDKKTEDLLSDDSKKHSNKK